MTGSNFSLRDDRAAPPTSMRWFRSPTAWLAAAVLVAGVVFRVVIYRSAIGHLQVDEATWGLMARRAEQGEFTTFFWGQSYGGTQEVAPVAVLFSIFGTHLVLMRLVPIAFSVVAALAIWRYGREPLGRREATAAALLLWIFPIYALWKVEVWSGFYGGGLLYSTLVLLLAFALDDQPTRGRIALMGLLLGLGFWESLQLVAVFVPVLAWLTLRRPRLWLEAWVAVPTAALGALPWIVSNLRHNWWSFTTLGGGSDYVSRLRGFASATFPMILGLRVPFSGEWLLGSAASALAYAAAVAGMAWLAWRWRRSTLSLLPVVVLAYPFLYALSAETSNTKEPRYVVVLVPALVLIAGKLATSLSRTAAVLVLAVALSGVGLARWIDAKQATAATIPFNTGEVELAPAIAWLDRVGLDRVYADYNIAYRLTFDTRERIVVSECDLHALSVVAPGRVLPPVPHGYRTHHHPAYDTAVRTAARFAYLFVRGERDEVDDVRLLRANGYTEHRIGTLLILASPDAQLMRPSATALHDSHNGQP